jgi:hypothetical protein
MGVSWVEMAGVLRRIRTAIVRLFTLLEPVVETYLHHRS